MQAADLKSRSVNFLYSFIFIRHNNPGILPTAMGSFPVIQRPDKLDLRRMLKRVRAGAVALLNQFRLCRQPMLHLVPGLRTLVYVTEVGLAGHFVW